MFKIMKFNFSRLPKRYVVCIMISFGFFVGNALNNNMNVAIVAMTTAYYVKLENGSTIETVDFNLTSVQKGYILSALPYGDLASKLVASLICTRFGGVLTFGTGIVLAGLLNIATPFTSHYGIYAIMILRALEGAFEGIGYPSMQEIYSKWSPPGERSQMIAAAIFGSDVANVICMTVYGLIAFYWGWASLFYFPAIFAIFWCCLWFKFVKSDPSSDPKISQDELLFLQNCIETRLTTNNKVHYPWKDIFTSTPVWTLIIANYVTSSGYVIVYSQLPLFLTAFSLGGPHGWLPSFGIMIFTRVSIFTDVLKFDIKTIGYTLSGSYVILIFVSPLGGILSDYLVRRKIFSLTTIRKLFSGIGGYSAAIFVAILPFSNSGLIVMLLVTLFLGCHGLLNTTILVNTLDIAPQHASLLYGIYGSFGSIAAIISPTIIGYIVSNQSREEWMYVYFYCSLLYIIAATVYIFIGSGDLEPWAVVKHQEKEQNQS